MHSESLVDSMVRFSRKIKSYCGEKPYYERV
jgi:hypothetical protein